MYEWTYVRTAKVGIRNKGGRRTVEDSLQGKIYLPTELIGKQVKIFVKGKKCRYGSDDCTIGIAREPLTLISRQRKWQLLKIQNGLCQTCGKGKIFKQYLCVKCLDKNIARAVTGGKDG